MARKRRAGEGSVYKLPDGNWMAQIRIYDETTGTSRKVRRRASSKAKALDELDTLRGDAVPVPSGDLTVAQFVGQWAETTLEVSNRKDTTKKGYRDLVRSPIVPLLGDTRLADFSPTEVERWLASLNSHKSARGIPYSANTKIGCYKVLKLAMDAAVRDGLLPLNPVEQVTRPRGERVIPHGLSVDEVDRLLEVAAGNEQWGPLITFMAYTGLRIGEALAMHWQYVNLEERTFSVTSSKTPSGRRTLPLVNEAAAALKAQRAWQRRMRLIVGSGWHRSDYVFVTGRGTPIDSHNARREQIKLLRAAGLSTKRPFHTLRHSLVRRLLRQGVPMPIVSQLIGHASIRTTVDVYGWMETPISADDLQAVLDQSGGRALR